MVRRLAASAMLAGALASAPAMAAPLPCLTTADAEALTLVALPDIIRETGSVCASRLPATSLIRQGNNGWLGRYDAEATRAWPAASAAIVKLSDPQMEVLLASDYARPLLTQMVSQLIVGRIAPSDCGMIDRLATQLQPLPPRNTAGVVVTLLQYLKSEKAKGATVAVPELPLCAPGTR